MPASAPGRRWRSSPATRRHGCRTWRSRAGLRRSSRPEAGLLAIDVGGGSTELVHGDGAHRALPEQPRHRFGAAHRAVRSEPIRPPPPSSRRSGARSEGALAALPAFPETVTVVGVAGTVTSLFAIAHGIEPYDAARVHRGWLTREDVAQVRARLCSLPARGAAAGSPASSPSRADVLPAGAHPLRDRAGAARLPAPGSPTAGFAGESCSIAGRRSHDRPPHRCRRLRPASRPRCPAPGYALGVLTFINLINYLDRYIVSGVIPRIEDTLRHRPRPGGLAADGLHHRLHAGGAPRWIRRRPLSAALGAGAEHLHLELRHASGPGWPGASRCSSSPGPSSAWARRATAPCRPASIADFFPLSAADPGALGLLRRHPGGSGAGLRARRMDRQHLELARGVLRRGDSRAAGGGRWRSGCTSRPGRDRGGRRRSGGEDALPGGAEGPAATTPSTG